MAPTPLHYVSLRSPGVTMSGMMTEASWQELRHLVNMGVSLRITRRTLSGVAVAFLHPQAESLGIQAEVAVTGDGQVLVPVLLPPGAQVPLPPEVDPAQAPAGSKPVSPAGYPALLLEVSAYLPQRPQVAQGTAQVAPPPVAEPVTVQAPEAP